MKCSERFNSKSRENALDLNDDPPDPSFLFSATSIPHRIKPSSPWKSSANFEPPPGVLAVADWGAFQWRCALVGYLIVRAATRAASNDQDHISSNIHSHKGSEPAQRAVV